MVLEIQFWSLKCTAVFRIRNNSATFHSYASDTRQEQCTTHSKQSSMTSNRMYLLKLYEKSIIVLLTNVLVNICCEISKIWLISWMVYACNVEGLEKVEKLGSLVEMNVLCIVDQDHQWWVIAVDHTSKFEVI